MQEIDKNSPLGRAVHDPQVERLMRRASYFSLSVGAFLALLKVIVWAWSDSLSLFASMFDSFFDMVASLVNLLAIRYALQPPDREHRFGHGKAEDVASFAQAAFISGSGLLIVIQGVRRFFDPQPLEHSASGIAVMIVSIALTSALVAYQRYVIRKTRSKVVQSDSLHYVSDLLANAAVIVALVLSAQFGVLWADPLFALLIAGYIFYGAWEIGYGAFQALLDHEFPDADRRKVKEICRAHPEVLDIHDLRTRRSGIYNFVQCHLVFDADISLRAANRIAHEVERKLKDAFPNLEVLIHEDPKGAE